jgi:acetylornithine deacetylase
MASSNAESPKASRQPTRSPVQPQRLLRLLHRMIDIYSPSGKEQELLGFLHGFLKKHNITAQRQPLEDGRYNLAIAPDGTEIELALIGHVDTVNAYDLEDMGFTQEKDQIFGLGAADMKSGCAALIEAYLCLTEAQRRTLPVALILVVGEEENGDGAMRLLEDYHFPWALIAEPTQMAPCLAHYGYIESHFTTRGERRHASLAKGRVNPVESMLKGLLALTRHMDTQRPEAVYNIRNLLTSPSGFAVPEWCEAWMDLHLPPHTPTGMMCAEIEETITATLNEIAENQIEVRFYTIQDGYDLPQKGLMIETLRDLFARRGLSWQPAAFQSHSDANLLWANGIKPILLGPGSLAKAHVPDESIRWEEIVSAAELYYDLINEMFMAKTGTQTRPEPHPRDPGR